jgi:hypothetical protein
VKATIAKRQTLSNYDASFEVILSLALAAWRGCDVSAMLVQTIEANLGELIRVEEFKVALGFIPRPADVNVPWLVTPDQSEVMLGKEGK